MPDRRTGFNGQGNKRSSKIGQTPISRIQWFPRHNFGYKVVIQGSRRRQTIGPNVRTRPERGITNSMLIVSDSNGAKSIALYNSPVTEANYKTQCST